MTTTTAIPMSSPADHRATRIDLAAAFRWFARLNMHESVANHLSVAVSADGSQFLTNPRGRHFSRISAGDLLLLDANDPNTLSRADAPDPTAWYLHARLHARLPEARCVMHLHSKYATALACLADPTLYPIDMNTMRFFGRVALDSGFSGMALSASEGDRIADLMGQSPDQFQGQAEDQNQDQARGQDQGQDQAQTQGQRRSEGNVSTKSVLLLANHGVLVIGSSVAAAFDEMYYFERAAETLLTCYATGKPLRRVSDEVAALTERQWRDYGQLAVDHLDNLKAILDVEEPSYRR